MSPNRIVAVLTPLVFAPLAGAVAAWLASHFPGVHVERSALEQVFIGGALIALAPAVQWLHGWQKHEARQTDFQHGLLLANATGGAPPVEAVAAEAVPAEDESDGVEGFDGFDGVDELAELDELAESDLFDADELSDGELADDELADDELETVS